MGKGGKRERREREGEGKRRGREGIREGRGSPPIFWPRTAPNSKPQF